MLTPLWRTSGPQETSDAKADEEKSEVIPLSGAAHGARRSLWPAQPENTASASETQKTVNSFNIRMPHFMNSASAASAASWRICSVFIAALPAFTAPTSSFTVCAVCVWTCEF